MDSCFEEMDADTSGTVEWDEFATFFGESGLLPIIVV